jgi:hypothetical protein
VTLIELSLRTELEKPRGVARRRRRIRWVTVRGGFPPGMDVADRESMYRWVGRRY